MAWGLFGVRKSATILMAWENEHISRVSQQNLMTNVMNL